MVIRDNARMMEANRGFESSVSAIIWSMFAGSGLSSMAKYRQVLEQAGGSVALRLIRLDALHDLGEAEQRV